MFKVHLKSEAVNLMSEEAALEWQAGLVFCRQLKQQLFSTSCCREAFFRVPGAPMSGILEA